MKRKVLYLIVFSLLFLFSSTAFAVNWIFVTNQVSDSDLFPSYTISIDIDNAVKVGDTIVYWELYTYDEPDILGVKYIIWKCQVKPIRPRMVRIMDEYSYDSSNNLLSEDHETGQWFKPTPADDQVIDTALKYVRAL